MIKFKWETEFKETPIGEIPKDWDVKKLKEFVSRAKTGGTPPTKREEYWNGDIPWVTSNHLKSLYVFKGDRTVTEKAIKDRKTSLAEKGAVLFGTRIGIGNVSIAGRDVAFNQDVTAVWLNTIHKEYLVRLIKSPFYQELLNNIADGTTVGGLDRDTLLSLPIAFPPREEQHRIATVLSWFDDLIENKRKQNEILEKTAMAIFKSWFIDFEPFQDEEFVYSEELGMEIPKGWEVKPIGEVAEFTNGLSYKGSEKFSEYEDGAYVFITLNNVKRGGGFKSEYAWIKSKRLKKRHFLVEGDLIMANTDMTQDAKVIGAPALVIFPSDYTKQIGVYSHHITRIQPKEKNWKLFMYLYLKYTQEDNVTFSTGTNVLGLDIDNFRQNKYILIPPKPILEWFHSLVEPLFQKIILNEKEIMLLKKARDTLLPQLVFGRLRVVEI